VKRHDSETGGRVLVRVGRFRELGSMAEVGRLNWRILFRAPDERHGEYETRTSCPDPGCAQSDYLVAGPTLPPTEPSTAELSR